MFFGLPVVLELRVEDWRDQRRGRPVADSGSGLGPGSVLDLVLVVELVRGAATDWGASFHERTLISEGNVRIQRASMWGKVAVRFLLT